MTIHGVSNITNASESPNADRRVAKNDTVCQADEREVSTTLMAEEATTITTSTAPRTTTITTTTHHYETSTSKKMTTIDRDYIE